MPLCRHLANLYVLHAAGINALPGSGQQPGNTGCCINSARQVNTQAGRQAGAAAQGLQRT